MRHGLRFAVALLAAITLTATANAASVGPSPELPTLSSRP